MNSEISRPRPTRSDEDVLAVAILALVPQIERWAQATFTTEQIAECRDLLRTGLLWSDDGYQFARKFESSGWTPDSELVDILDNADTELYRALRAAEEVWLVETRTRPRFGIGAKVVFPKEQLDAGAEGEISEINEKAGTYTVFAPTLGHVREGLGTRGRIFTWEMLERANPEATSGAAA